MKPTHKIMQPIPLKDGKTFWNRIGSGWESEKTLKIKLNSFPLGGEMCVFKIEEKLEGEDAGDQVQPEN